MLLIPAIDLKDGHCVRLKQGDMNDSTTFGDDPAMMARRWVDAGARRLHLVDLNGAFAGKPVNEAAIKAILAEVGEEIPVQLGGGIRDLDTIERYLDDGLSFIIIGTAAVKNPGFLRDACSAFGGHIIVGLDAKDGKDVAAEGAARIFQKARTLDRSGADDDEAEAVVEVAFDGVEVADATAQLDRNLVAHLGQDRFDSGLVDRLAGEGAVQVDQVQAARPGVDPAPRHRSRVFAEGGGVVHVALFQTHELAVFEVDCGDQQHGRGRVWGGWGGRCRE